METATPVKPDPQVELMELKRAVMMFCHTMEMCHLASSPFGKELLQIQMDCPYYKQMKSLIKK